MLVAVMHFVGEDVTLVRFLKDLTEINSDFHVVTPAKLLLSSSLRWSKLRAFIYKKICFPSYLLTYGIELLCFRMMKCRSCIIKLLSFLLQSCLLLTGAHYRTLSVHGEWQLKRWRILYWNENLKWPQWSEISGTVVRRFWMLHNQTPQQSTKQRLKIRKE